MRSFRKMTLAALVAVPLSVGLVVPASASTSVPAKAVAVKPSPQAPFPSCGEHFLLQRKGSDVRVVGTDLYVFSKGYMWVFAAANGNSYGPYNASPNGGASFEINTGSTAQTTIAISLTDDGNTVTLCASDYYA